ncbi:hypothetical protein BDQ12DRAFT_725893 [Crucibulum laeve]|uniref:Integral membrane protein n=1 Tax=Crucibulum laeve TaxID=68775 RepID=A0A5C3LT93_9AGAR|nr:hypothetical protein BDQ12DRAFT_725893 [Crucibulum laeve]
MAQAKDYGPTVGAFEAGVLMSMFLSGITTAQAYRYFHNFPNDPKRMKLFVALVWFLEFGHGTILSVALYWLTVLNFNSTTALVNPLKKLCLATILSSITTSMIQCYFAFRVHIICQMRIIPVICVILSVVHLTGQFMLAIGGYKARSITEFKIRWRTVMIAVLSSSTCADVLIASCLCWRFRRRRKEKFLGSVINSDIEQYQNKHTLHPQEHSPACGSSHYVVTRNMSSYERWDGLNAGNGKLLYFI